MKLTEAKEIVSYILEWQLVCMGVKGREEISKTLDLSKYSLSDLIKANAMVEANNHRKQKLADYNRQKGNKVKGYSHSMFLADRLIAAAYTAISYETSREPIALINDVCVGCVKAKYDE